MEELTPPSLFPFACSSFFLNSLTVPDSSLQALLQGDQTSEYVVLCSHETRPEVLQGIFGTVKCTVNFTFARRELLY